MLITIRKDDIIGMWRADPTINNGHRLNVIKGVELLQLVGLSPKYPPLGPFPF